MCCPSALGRLGLEGDDRRVGLVLAAVEVLDVVDEAAVVLEDLLEAAGLRPLDRVVPGTVDVAGDRVVLDGVDDRLGPGALVADDELDALVEERHLAQAGGDRLEVVVGVLEDSSEAYQVTVVPVPSPASIGRTCSRSASGVPSWKVWRHRWPRFLTSATSREESALTTETPTPWRPPETL